MDALTPSQSLFENELRTSCGGLNNVISVKRFLATFWSQIT